MMDMEVACHHARNTHHLRLMEVVRLNFWIQNFSEIGPDIDVQIICHPEVHPGLQIQIATFVSFDACQMIHERKWKDHCKLRTVSATSGEMRSRNLPVNPPTPAWRVRTTPLLTFVNSSSRMFRVSSPAPVPALDPWPGWKHHLVCPVLVPDTVHNWQLAACLALHDASSLSPLCKTCTHVSSSESRFWLWTSTRLLLCTWRMPRLLSISQWPCFSSIPAETLLSRLVWIQVIWKCGSEVDRSGHDERDTWLAILARTHVFLVTECFYSVSAEPLASGNLNRSLLRPWIHGPHQLVCSGQFLHIFCVKVVSDPEVVSAHSWCFGCFSLACHSQCLWNDTEKISMSLSQWWQSSIEKCSQVFLLHSSSEFCVSFPSSSQGSENCAFVLVA